MVGEKKEKRTEKIDENKRRDVGGKYMRKNRKRSGKRKKVERQRRSGEGGEEDSRKTNM